MGPLITQGGVPPQIIQGCRHALIETARPYGAVQVDVVSAGWARQDQNGEVVAPVDVKVTYMRSGARQIRQARISCQLDAQRKVLALR